LQDYDDFEVNDLEKLNTRLQLLYHLFQKHQVTTIAELMQKKDALSQKVERVTDASNLLETKKTAVTTKKKELKSLGEKISKRRKNILQKLEKDLALILHELGMPNALFSVKLNPTDSFFSNGIDEVQFLFTANKGGKLKPIKQVASGGELSRIMLAVKSVMAVHSKLPTVIFDEIDSGISGEIAIKMANIMSKMAKNMQVIAITHLPQIVAKGKQHLRVYKYEDNQQTKTNIKLLTYKERLREIAEMLGGKQITETALNHAKQLLTAGQ
jgi:DNA repair protein RecN (Recombination protein N)